MKERGILFSAPMVRAILSGRKTVTRRILGNQGAIIGMDVPQAREHILSRCPYGAAGDRLWVRETWMPHDTDDSRNIRYRADGDVANTNLPWKPSIFMPRWASRITLEVVGVRVERLQEITNADAVAEGVDPGMGFCDFSIPHHREAFERLWDEINGKRAPWASNPLVWRVEFRMLPQ